MLSNAVRVDDFALWFGHVTMDEEKKVIWFKHRHTRVKNRQFSHGPFDAEQMGDAHLVQGPIHWAVWDVKDQSQGLRRSALYSCSALAPRPCPEFDAFLGQAHGLRRQCAPMIAKGLATIFSPEVYTALNVEQCLRFHD